MSYYSTSSTSAEARKIIDNDEELSHRQLPGMNIIYGAATLLVFGVLGVFLISSASTSSSYGSFLKGSTPISKVKKSSSSEINFTLKRKGYDVLPYFDVNYDSFMKYALLDDYNAVIEPYQEMELALYDSEAADSGHFEFIVCKMEQCQMGITSHIGSEKSVTTVKFDCTPYDQFDITVKEFNQAAENIKTVKGTAICMYVRREVRTLAQADLDKYLDASAKLNELTEEEGRKLYGNQFHSSSYVVRFHHFNAAQQDQDHIHEGNGFLAQHLKITNIFDAAVRSVDPSESLPYWDFTKDQLEGKKSYNTVLSDSKVYGTTGSPAVVSSGFTYDSDQIINGRIKDGRWKDLKAEKNLYYPDLDYGYGYMRAPWNMNPSPYVSRFAFDFGGAITWPSCSAHYTILQYDDMMDFFIRSSFGPHATTHTMFSGYFGCDLFYPLWKAGYVKSKNDALAICSSWSFFIKECWRSNMLIARKGCTVAEDVNESKCGFDCNADNDGALLDFFYEKMKLWIDPTKEGSDDAWKSFLCGGDAGKVFTGDHLESASPSDPTFWVIHPTLERLLHAKLMSGGFTNEEWAVDTKKDYVCNHVKCFNATTGLKDYYDDCCYGHFEHDRLMNAITGNRKDTIGLTNGEMISATDPRSKRYSMPYIYDNFVWSHCEEDFDGLLNSLKSNAVRGISKSSVHPDQLDTQLWKKRMLEQSKRF